jgi:hypothetical protein
MLPGDMVRRSTFSRLWTFNRVNGRTKSCGIMMQMVSDEYSHSSFLA